MEIIESLKINISFNVDTADCLVLLDFFIPPEIYATITENPNLYVISKNVFLVRIKLNSRYWWLINENEIRVLFGILYYMGVYKEPNYRIYWEMLKLNGPIHALSMYMIFNRYENFRHFLYVSQPALEFLIKNQQSLFFLYLL